MQVPERFRELNADHLRQYDLIKVSGLKYIMVCPPHISGESVLLYRCLKYFTYYVCFSNR